MTPKPLPKKYEKSWRKWPSFDDLRGQYPELKVHQLRGLLGSVPCFRCPDQTARYIAEDAAKALLNAPVQPAAAAAPATPPPPTPPTPSSRRRRRERDDEDDDDDRDDIELAEPKVYDAMILFRQCLVLCNDMRQTQVDLANSMQEPLKLGLQLVREQTEMMVARLKHLESVSDRMTTVTESLLSEQAGRELAKLREESAVKLRGKAFEIAAGYVPTIVENFKPTAQATAALEAVSTLEPEVLDAIVDSDEATESQRAAWTKLRDVLRSGRRQPPQQQQTAENVGQATPDAA